MARDVNTNSSLDFIFRTPKKLSFTKLYRYYFDFILRLLYRVILIKGVPKTINETFLKMILFTQGKICFLEGQLIGENQKELLALNCSPAETPDVYYIPRNVLVVNPRLSKSYSLKRDEECVVVYLSETDKYNLSGINGGLYNLIEKTAVMLADNDISLNIAQKNTRLVNIIAADTQNTVDSIKATFAKMYEGDPDIVVKSSLVDKLQGVPIVQNTTYHNLIELLEVNQYVLAHFLEQIGICVHDQMKRERLITGEVNDNLSFAFLSVDDIITSLNEGFDKVNAKYGTELSAELNPIILEQQKDAAPEDQTEEDAAPEDQTEEDAAPEDQTEEDAAPEDQTEEDASPEDQTEEDAAPEDQTEEDAAPEDQTEDQTEDAAPEETNIDINIEGDNNVIIIEGGEDNGQETDEDELPNLGSDHGEGADG